MTLLALCEGNPLFTSGFPLDSPHKGPVMWSFYVFILVSLNKMLNSQKTWDFQCHDIIAMEMCTIHIAKS